MLFSDPLADFAQLTHQQRLTRLVELGRRSKKEPALKKRLAELRAGDFCERQWALYACYGSGDGDWVARSLQTDPSRGLRALALSMTALFCSDEQILANLPSLSLLDQRKILAALKSRRRLELVDSFVKDAQGSQLPLGSRALVERLLPGVEDAYGIDEWTRLARNHPVPCVDALIRQLNSPQGGPENTTLVGCINALLPTLVRDLPDLALQLVDAASAALHSLARLNLHGLLGRRPCELVERLLSLQVKPVGALASQVAKIAHRLRPEQRQALLQKGWLRNPEGWLKRLPVEERETIWRGYSAGWLSPQGFERPHRLAWLGPQLRQEVALQHWQNQSLQARPETALPYATYLGYTRAQSELSGWLRSPDPDLRGGALAALIGAARFEEEARDLALAMLRSKNNEPDPVRLKILQALTELTPGDWKEPHLAGLQSFIEGALKAADLSFASMSQAELLVARLLPFYPQWSSAILAKLLQHAGRTQSSALGRGFSAANCAILEKELLPVLQKWLPVERNQAILGVAAALGKQFRHCPKLIDTVEALSSDPRALESLQAFYVLQAQVKARLAHFIPSLLKKDSSWILIDAVGGFVSRQRQDLLGPTLAKKPIKGRFATGKTIPIPASLTAFERWTSHQQNELARHLEALADNHMTDFPTVSWCLRRLSRLPAVVPTALRRYAALAESRSAVREEALRCLSRHDGDGEIFKDLAEALEDERARIAIYAMGRVVRRLPVEQAGTFLEALDPKQITVAKEVVRLLGELRGQRGLPSLLQRAAKPLHRDVRIALQRALWSHLDRSEVWEILEKAAADSDPAVVVALAAVPALGQPSAIRQSIANLRARLLENPSPYVRGRVLQQMASASVNASLEPMRGPLLNLLNSAIDSERGTAAALLVKYFSRLQPELFAQSAPQLEVRGLQALCANLNGENFALAARHLGEALAASWPSLSLGLLASALPVEEFLAKAEGALASGVLDWPLLDALRAAWPHLDRESAPALIEATWGQHENPRLRFLALDYLLYTTTARGWVEGARESLQRFQADSDPAVAQKARLIVPPPQL